jgi:hypothetical protein
MNPETIKTLPVIIYCGMKCHQQLFAAPSPTALARKMAALCADGWVFSPRTKTIQMGAHGPCYRAGYFPQLLLDIPGNQ